LNQKIMSASFLRGVPAEEALAHLVPLVAEGYKKVINRYGTDVLQYGHFSGLSRLREILGIMHKTDPSRIIVGNGGMEVISFLFKSLPHVSTILIEESTYDRVISDAEQYGHKLVGIKLTPDGIDINDLQKAASSMPAALFYGIPYHHNPTGITYSTDNRKAVEDICRQHGILCAWDICYESLRYDGGRNEPIAVSEWGPVLLSSFTKTLSPGTKCGYMVLPKERMESMEKIVANTRLNPNLPTQAFIADFIETGKYDAYQGYLRGLYKPKMDALNAALLAHFPGAFSAKSRGGFFATITLQAIARDKETAFINAAKEAGVGIAAGWGAVAPNFVEEKRKEGLLIRLTYPASKTEQLSWGIEKLKEVERRFS
jgi:2-aminoadipate transaminase